MPDNKADSQATSDTAKASAVSLIETFRKLSEKSPDAAARLALRVFLTPEKRRRPAWEEELRLSARKLRIFSGKNELSVYSWRSGPNVLLSHCWGGRGTQLGAFVPPLVNAGYSVTAFDGPAHGDSQGSQTDMMEFSAAISDVAKAIGPIHAALGHSFGAANTLLAIRDYGLSVSRLVLIGCFSHAICITEAFGNALNISQSIIADMRSKLEARYDGKLDWENLNLALMAQSSQVPILLIHDEDDREIPYHHALKINAESKNCSLYATKGLGHRRILRDQNVVNKAVGFITAATSF